MTVSAARGAIADALGTIDGLTVYEVWPSHIAVPSALIDQVGGQYARTFEGGLDVQFGIILLVSGLNAPGEWMNLLDEYLEPEGDTSVDAALANAGYSLASFENPGKYDVNGQQFYGVHLTTQPVLI